jgi:hypothetical protein
MAGTQKSKVAAAAAAAVETKNVESVSSTTTTTVVTAVEETITLLEVTGESVTAIEETASTAVAIERELPIFSNTLLANAAIAGNSVTHKPKSGRVKATGGKNSVPVLKITAPKTDGEVVVMRRMDSDLVNATTMYNAAYPSVSEAMQTLENDYLAKKYETEGAVVEEAGSGALAGVW